MMGWMLTVSSVHPMSMLITDLFRISGLYSLIPELVVIHDLDGMLANLALSWRFIVLFFVSLTGTCRNDP